MGNTGVTHFC